MYLFECIACGCCVMVRTDLKVLKIVAVKLNRNKVIAHELVTAEVFVRVICDLLVLICAAVKQLTCSIEPWLQIPN